MNDESNCTIAHTSRKFPGDLRLPGPLGIYIILEYKISGPENTLGGMTPLLLGTEYACDPAY